MHTQRLKQKGELTGGHELINSRIVSTTESATKGPVNPTGSASVSVHSELPVDGAGVRGFLPSLNGHCHKVPKLEALRSKGQYIRLGQLIFEPPLRILQNFIDLQGKTRSLCFSYLPFIQKTG